MKTTQFRIIVALIALCLLLTSCMQQPVETQPPETQTTTAPTIAPTTEPSNEPESRKLYVAYMETDLASVQIVESFVSEDIELIPVILSEESFDDFLLRHDYYADVILIPNTTEISTAAYALDYRVGKMNRFLPEITEGVDYYPVLDAGVVDGFQYYLPLRFEVPYLLTTQQQMDQTEISLPSKYTMKQWMQEVNRCAENYEPEDGVIVLLQPEANIGAALYDALRLSGVWAADPTEKAPPVSEPILSEYAQYVKTAWDQTETAYAQLAASRSMHPYPLSRSDQIAFVQGQGCIPDVFMVYDAVCTDAQFLPYPQYEKANAVTAEITLYAAIWTGDQKQDEIREFLRHAFTTPEGQGVQQGLSVCCTAVQSYLDGLSQQTERIYGDGPFFAETSGLSDVARKACEKALNQIVSGSIRNAYWVRTFSTAMEGFTNGSVSYDECFDKLKARLYSAPEEAGLSMFALDLPEELKQEIDRERTYRYYGDRYPIFEFAWCEFAGEKLVSGEKSYYGTFNGSIACRPLIDTPLCVSTYYKIGSVVIDYGDDFKIEIYRNGVFFDLTDAYKRGFITEADAAVIAERLASFEAARKASR